MLVATWNVNSIRARLERFISWLKFVQPDVVCLQETKVQDHTFPFEPIEALGYNVAVNGQKSYNGVAIVSKYQINDIKHSFASELDSHGSRFISAVIEDIKIMSIYAPNGASVELEQYTRKLQWYHLFIKYLQDSFVREEKTIIGGDFNIAYESIDLDRPSDWEGSVLYNTEICGYLDRLIEMGFLDAFRIHQKEAGYYSWWDYRNMGFQTNNGLRIDYLFVSTNLSYVCNESYIDRDQRKGLKPSDHVPVLASFV
jgi:exodeoxyribonuclease-3